MIIKVVGNSKELKKSMACLLAIMGKNAKLTDLIKIKGEAK